MENDSRLAIDFIFGISLSVIGIYGIWQSGHKAYDLTINGVSTQATIIISSTSTEYRTKDYLCRLGKKKPTRKRGSYYIQYDQYKHNVKGRLGYASGDKLSVIYAANNPETFYVKEKGFAMSPKKLSVVMMIVTFFGMFLVKRSYLREVREAPNKERN